MRKPPAKWCRDSPVALMGVVLVTGCYSIGTPRRLGVSDFSYYDRFGTTGLSASVSPGSFGGLRGLGDGWGVTVYIPALYPVQCVVMTVAVAAAVPVAAVRAVEYDNVKFTSESVEAAVREIAGQFHSEEGVRSGLDGVLTDITRNILSDLSVELAWTMGQNEDLDRGGNLSYVAALLGIRACGGRTWGRPRAYLMGGGGWYELRFDNRPDAWLPGVYVGVGLEIFDPSTSYSLCLEYRADIFLGDDVAGDSVDGGLSHVGLVGRAYW